ncbi:hypothetical protein [Mucilaginibacter ginsenosidivorans]|uniref:Uncharacterized protein n=1 Tax=Mucilaginibacter ginsenosidivorans TaxID=398053 RepID=A0A5B8UU08_9SPHI|nr:hypothetical protein [Mucilaginibacter ginsenosidivorans]QEC62534.1 hypothetical protein FRZ54_08005 [Mucilaginibacter ginsenosidivorans]
MDTLQQPLNQLAFSPDFLARSGDMGFRCLQDILDCTPAAILKKERFSYLWLEELTTYLSAKGWLTLWQPWPGNNAR